MAKAIILDSILLALFSLVSSSLCDASIETETSNGFTIDLIHREYSPQSPSYNHSLSPSQRLLNSLQRSLQRFQRFNNHKTGSPALELSNARGEYILKYSVGSPPVLSFGIADTGSDIIWTQCQPCPKCFNQISPLFRPTTSSTYKRVPCNAPSCKSMKQFACSRGAGNNCLYSESYVDGSFTQGELATDTFAFGAVSVPNVLFGCGFRNDVVFERGESGIIGLGGGKVSLVRQLGQGRFSYCLAPFLKNLNSGKLNFGGKVSGVTTPLVKKAPENFYYLTLDGMSVGNRRVESWSPREEGNIIIDSGTTFMFLPTGFYSQIEKALADSIKLRRINDPRGVFGLCYFTLQGVKIPDVVVHFRGGDVKLRHANIFVRTSDDSVCFAARPAQWNVGFYGNVAQINFLVGYDLEKGSVSFRPADCAK